MTSGEGSMTKQNHSERATDNFPFFRFPASTLVSTFGAVVRQPY